MVLCRTTHSQRCRWFRNLKKIKIKFVIAADERRQRKYGKVACTHATKTGMRNAVKTCDFEENHKTLGGMFAFQLNGARPLIKLIECDFSWSIYPHISVCYFEVFPWRKMEHSSQWITWNQKHMQYACCMHGALPYLIHISQCQHLMFITAKHTLHKCIELMLVYWWVLGTHSYSMS